MYTQRYVLIWPLHETCFLGLIFISILSRGDTYLEFSKQHAVSKVDRINTTDHIFKIFC